MSLFETGIRPIVDDWLLKKAAERRDYGDYWSASSAGYCMRRNILERLKVPYTKEDARKQRVFTAGDCFHEWIQRITKEAGVSIAQELELQDEGLMVRGHIDDLVLVNGNLILIDYKSQNSRAFSYQKEKPMSHYHKMQVGTYVYMMRLGVGPNYVPVRTLEHLNLEVHKVSEARILKISKDDLRMSEQQLIWSPTLEKEIVQYWTTLNGYWKVQRLPKCTCADYEGGFLAREAYNPFFYDGEPCSVKWLLTCMKEGKVEASGWKAEK